MITVQNYRTYVGPGEYVGRPFPLGNPFKIGRDGSREEVIEKYHQWLRQQWRTGGAAKKELLRLVEKYQRKGSLVLLCHCAPLPCHADIIKSAIEGILRRAHGD
jgi:hypothetical protein